MWKLSHSVDLGKWNITLIASITTTSSSSRHELIHATSMQLQTACAKSDFPSPPWFGKPLTSNKLLANEEHS